jgi:hypothetical protein
VVLRVADDGVGIREGQLDKRAEGHLGLRLLIDRVADQGGSMEVVPRPGGGTLALARVPIASLDGPIPRPRPASSLPGPGLVPLITAAPVPAITVAALPVAPTPDAGGTSGTDLGGTDLGGTDGARDGRTPADRSS